MLGERSDQHGLWETDRLYLDLVGRDSFYGLLASMRGQLFRGAEAKASADFDIRWNVALEIEIEEPPFAKSRLQVFLAQLILQDKVREVFERSLRLARAAGHLNPNPPTRQVSRRVEWVRKCSCASGIMVFETEKQPETRSTQ